MIFLQPRPVIDYLTPKEEHEVSVWSADGTALPDIIIVIGRKR